MFRKVRTVINGIELSDDFSGASVINNIAISSDGKRYAVIKNGNVIYGDVPLDGKLNINDTVINLQRGVNHIFNIGNMYAGRSIISDGNISINSGSIEGGNITISGENICIGRKLLYEINESYEFIKKVSLKETSNDINLVLSNDSKVYVDGLTSTKPECRDGRLFIDNFQGMLKLPRNLEEINIKTSSGDISGNIAHSGSIKTSSGDVNLSLHIPLIVEVSTSSGDIDVENMISKGHGVYVPPNAKPGDTLTIDTSSGDVCVKYVL